MEHLIEAVASAIAQNTDEHIHFNWTLKRLHGGMNGIVYRVEDDQSPHNPLVVKIRKRDERHRAVREFFALQALEHFQESISPKPLGLYTDLPNFYGDIVISSWVEGEVLNDLSTAPYELWEGILTSFSRCHRHEKTSASPVKDAVLSVRSTLDLIAEIERRYANLPDIRLGEITKNDIGRLFNAFKTEGLRNTSPARRLGLITGDANPSNLIKSPSGIVMVDWENSGWGDPAFDIADLLVRPNCMGVSPATRNWIISRYAEMMGDSQMVERVLAYERLLLIFWLILTSTGFIPKPVQVIAGTRTFTLEQTTAQQLAYLQRIAQVE